MKQLRKSYKCWKLLCYGLVKMDISARSTETPVSEVPKLKERRSGLSNVRARGLRRIARLGVDAEFLDLVVMH
jgi:hypothetical protein